MLVMIKGKSIEDKMVSGKVYLKWTKEDIKNLYIKTEVSTILTEVDSDGIVLREIGLDEKGEIVYFSPSKKNNYGLFDNQIVEYDPHKKDIGKEEFEIRWNEITFF